MKSCENCCLWPCDRTDTVCDGSHYERRNGRIVKVVEVPPLVADVLEKAILETLESEVK